MALSADTIKQFVAITNDSDTSSKEGTANGTIVEYNGNKYAKLDGSDELTPITASVKVQNGDRVVVTIKNHKAMVLGDTTNPAISGIELDELGNILISKMVTFESLANGTTVIDGGCIKTGKISADRIDLSESGVITFGALSEEVVQEIEDAYAMGEDAQEQIGILSGEIEDLYAEMDEAQAAAAEALNDLALLADGKYTGHTFIDGKNIYSPNLYGDTVNLLDGNSKLVGTMSLVYSQTYALDITSQLSLRLNAAAGYNTFIGTSGGPNLLLTGTAEAGNARCQLGGGALVISSQSYGDTLPENPVNGQVYFLLDE